jgi:hypothetical protein
MCSDAQWRAWLLNQTRSRSPIGGIDVELHDLLNTFTGVEQKATHQGWDLRQHSIAVALAVETDATPCDRTALRIAGLWHDAGKIHNGGTPGCHEAVGRKMFLRGAPPWLTLLERDLVAGLIATHDVFGRLARGITERQDGNLDAVPTYKGALSPGVVRAMLLGHGVTASQAMILWTADVSAVAALRWLLPIAGELLTLVLG